MLRNTNNDEKDAKQEQDHNNDSDLYYPSNPTKNDNDKDKYQYCPNYDSYLSAIKPKLRERFLDHLKKREAAILAAIKKVYHYHININTSIYIQIKILCALCCVPPFISDSVFASFLSVRSVTMISYTLCK